MLPGILTSLGAVAIPLLVTGPALAGNDEQADHHRVSEQETPEPGSADLGRGNGDGGEDALPCRPTIACTADIVSAGKLEVEGGYAGRRLGGGYQNMTPVIAKLSLTSSLQVQVGTNGFVQERETASFFDDVVLAAKYRFFEQEGARPSMAVSLGIGIPTPGGQQGYEPGYDANVTAYVSKDLGPVHADLNLAATLMDLGQQRVLQPLACLSMNTELADRRLIPMLEGYWYGSARGLAKPDHGLLMAMGIAVARDLVFDVGWDWGMGGQDRRYTVFVGVTALTKRLWAVRTD